MQDRRHSVNAACELMCDTVQRLDKDFNGNGQPGVKQIVQAIREDIAAMRGAADERQKATERRHWLVMAILSALTVAVALMAIPGIAHSFHVGDLKIPSIISNNEPTRVYDARMGKQRHLSEIRSRRY